MDHSFGSQISDDIIGVGKKIVMARSCVTFVSEIYIFCPISRAFFEEKKRSALARDFLKNCVVANCLSRRELTTLKVFLVDLWPQKHHQ